MKTMLVRVIVGMGLCMFGFSQIALADQNQDEQDQPHAQTYVEPKTGMEFVWVPKGKFLMGQCEKEKEMLINEIGQENYEKNCTDELPQHEDNMPGMWIGKYEVTREEFKTFVEDTEYETGAEIQGFSMVWEGKWKKKEGIYWDNPGFVPPGPSNIQDKDGNGEKQPDPVVHVSWNDAKAMAIWVTKVSNGVFRLPTEDEWEYAVRAETETCRFWGEKPDDACAYANVADVAANQEWPNLKISSCNDGYAGCAPVGKFEPNGFDLYDMLGNVREWCEDPYYEDAYIRHIRDNCCCENFGTFGSEVVVYVNDAEHVRIHTSCSEPIEPGMKFGDFELIEGFSRLCGLRCPVGEKPRDGQSEECGPCEGKVSELTLRYDGLTNVTVRVEQGKDGEKVFDQEIRPRSEFTFQGTREWSNDCYEAFEKLMAAGRTREAVVGALRCGATCCDTLGATVGLGVSPDETLMTLIPMMKNPPLAAGNEGPLRVVRGGSWLSAPEGVRSAKRSSNPPTAANNSLGFRLVWVRPEDVTSCVRSPRVESITSGENRKGTTSPHTP